MEFCNSDTAWLVDYELVPVPEQEYIWVRPGQKWAEPSIHDAAAKMRACFSDVAERQRKVQAAHELVTSQFSPAAIARRYESRLHEILPAAITE